MMYEFERADGTIAEEYYPAAKAPKLGRWVKLKDGSRGKRILSVPGALKVRGNVHFQALSQEPGLPGAKHYAPDGAPRFASRREAINYAHRNNLTYDGE
jgi:hypothetical protein